MKKYLIIITSLFLGGVAFGQGRVVLSSSRPGLTVCVKDAVGDIKQPLEGADVKLIIRKDTIRLKTDTKGEAYYRGPFRAPTLKIIVNHQGYESQERERKSPADLATVSGQVIYLKRK